MPAAIFPNGRAPIAARASALALTCALAFALSYGACAEAGDLEDGMAAFNTEDFVTALKLWRPLAEQGNAEAQFNVATMYAEGKGVQASDIIAAVWYQRAAEQGHPAAQYNLGASYAEGLGVRKDDALAAKWFRRAADQGMPYAQLNLGLLYAAGNGVPQDNVEAAKWIELAVFALPPGAARSDAAKALKDVADKMTDEELLKSRTLQRDYRANPEAKPAPPKSEAKPEPPKSEAKPEPPKSEAKPAPPK